jgi:hypothetical protein
MNIKYNTLDSRRVFAMQGDDPYFNKLIRILATRCMTQVSSFYPVYMDLISMAYVCAERKTFVASKVFCSRLFDARLSLIHLVILHL